ncbi:hypothetical protein C8R43DRAFT_269096 [Mycena crocata]|nr:hypothetical protein C8R43DRAFT_269096 [Mycena crocata]
MASRGRDDIDSSLVLTGPRVRVSSNRLADPNNSEPLDASHKTVVAKSLATVAELIDEIEGLARTLPKSIPKAERNGEIWRVLNKVKGLDTGPAAKSSTFVRRMDVLFGSTARDSDGRMTQIRRGSAGILLVIQYLRKIDWKSDGIPLAIATLKLTQLLEEMQHLCSNAITTTPTPGSPTSPTRSPREAGSDAEEFAPSKTIRTTRNGTASVENSDDSEDEDEPSPAAAKVHTSKRKIVTVDADSESDSSTEPGKKKTKTGTGPSRATKNGDRIRATKGSRSTGKTPRSDPTVLGEDGMLADIEVQPLVAVAESKPDPTADIKKFFGEPLMMKGKRGPELKLHRKCITCGEHLVAEATTNRRHMAKHADVYRAWCQKSNFESKLEDDISARKKVAADAEEAKAKLHQQTLDPHLRDKPERVVPYSDAAFRDAALDWLIATDQPIDALNHPKFKEMINIAARATNGVKIPGKKATRDEILNLFQKQMDNLRMRIHVSLYFIRLSAMLMRRFRRAIKSAAKSPSLVMLGRPAM